MEEVCGKSIPQKEAGGKGLSASKVRSPTVLSVSGLTFLDSRRVVPRQRGGRAGADDRLPKRATVNLATSAPDPITAPAPAICRYISDDSERCLAITGIVDPCPAPMKLPAGTGSTVSLGGTASHHSGFACFFTTSTPFSHLAST